MAFEGQVVDHGERFARPREGDYMSRNEEKIRPLARQGDGQTDLRPEPAEGDHHQVDADPRMGAGGEEEWRPCAGRT